MSPAPPPTRELPLLLATFIVAVSGLVYELLAGTLSSYLLGDSVYQFSLVIGLFMTALGVGAYLSRFVQKDLERAFVLTQTGLGTLGGLSAPLLFFAFSHLDNYGVFLVLVCVVVGTLMGLEIPLITRILQHRRALKLTLSNVLTADYIGALVAALLFPLVLVPQLGLIRTSLVFGLLNLGVAGLCWWLFRDQVGLRLGWLVALPAMVLGLGLVASEPMVGFFEQQLYNDEVILARTTPYQRLVLTRQGERLRLFLNGGLQFDSQDEYRYHEALVHPVMGLAGRRERVLVLGGGDGMAVREVLRHPDVESVTLVDLDPVVTGLFRDNPLLADLNDHSLQDPRVEIVNQDAWKFLETAAGFYNVIIIDLPDPHSPALGKLYTRAFYSLAARVLARDGMLVTQATSPLYAREAFWCIHHTLAATPGSLEAGETLRTLPYHAYVPSFGAWGFVLAGHQQPRWDRLVVPAGLRFLDAGQLVGMRRFPADMAMADVAVNTLQAQPLLGYYEAGWGRWFP